MSRVVLVLAEPGGVLRRVRLGTGRLLPGGSGKVAAVRSTEQAEGGHVLAVESAEPRPGGRLR